MYLSSNTVWKHFFFLILGTTCFLFSYCPLFLSLIFPFVSLFALTPSAERLTNCIWLLPFLTYAFEVLNVPACFTPVRTTSFDIKYLWLQFDCKQFLWISLFFDSWPSGWVWECLPLPSPLWLTGVSIHLLLWALSAWTPLLGQRDTIMTRRFSPALLACTLWLTGMGSKCLSTLLQVEPTWCSFCSKAADGCRLKVLFSWAISLFSSVSPLRLLSYFLRMHLYKSI